MTKLLEFPKNFKWGTATASYQIEGGVYEDGKGESIWDVFSHTSGRVINNENADVACDHYHLWQQDINLMKSLGYKSYRFSLSWPRIFPDGVGRINQAGLDFYNKLIDALLEAEIEPFVTLYHWDLPAALPGAWLNRAIVDAFADYSGTVLKAFGDRVKTWFTINEPLCASHLSYSWGEHAPGMKDLSKGLLAAHHLLLAHGKAVQELRSAWKDAQVGIVLNMSCVNNDPDAPVSEDIIRHIDGETNRWFIDPIYGRGYPQDMLEDYVEMGALGSKSPDFIKPGDMALIAQPTDLLGINYYTRIFVSMPPEDQRETHKFVRKQFPPEQITEMDWEVYPQGFFDILYRVHQEYHPKQIMVTENGASYSDGPDESGKVHDQRRIDYFQTHLQALWRAIQAGVPVTAYIAWSLMDNFEWAHGYAQRFGLVFVDYKTLQRIPKDSAYWYAEVIKRNGIFETMQE